MKKILALGLILILALGLTACDVVTTDENVSGELTSSTSGNQNAGENNQNEGEVEMNKYANVETNPVVTMVIKDLGTVKMELYPQVAPESVENFISLVSGEFYNGLTFHRVIPGFMAQGGDPDGNGTGGADYNIKGEFIQNGVANNISHTRGVLSMARSQAPNSASSQFFIVTTDSTYLDGQYAAFGKVIEGMEVVDAVVKSEVIRRQVDEGVDYYTDPEEYIRQSLECDRPVNPPVIESATVETFGVQYDEPTKLK